MNFVDIIIIIFILFSGVVGFKRGIFSEIVIVVGTILLFVISYNLKNPLADFLMLKLPFFTFSGNFKGIVVLNILIYQGIAFLVIASILSIILTIIMKITGIFEKLLKYTVILGIPSKVLGFVAGIIEGYVVVFIVLLFVSQFIFNTAFIDNSKIASKISNNTLFLTQAVSNTKKSIGEIYDLVTSKEYENPNQFNLKAMDIMLKNKIITVESTEKLMAVGKLEIDGLPGVVDKHRGE